MLSISNVTCSLPGVRVFVVHSEEREGYERGLREMSMERVREDLEASQAQVQKGELKEPEKIGPRPRPDCDATTVTVILTGNSGKENFISSSIRSTWPGRRPWKASTSCRPKNGICHRSRPSRLTRN